MSMTLTKDELGRRRYARSKVFEVAAIHAADGSAPCVVDDVSAQGVLVSCGLPLRPDQKVIFEAEEFGRVSATVVHVRDTLFGLSLDLKPEQQAEYDAWLAAAEKEDRD